MTPVGDGLRSYTVAATAALVIAAGSFVKHRNHSYRQLQVERASAAAADLARGQAPPANIAAHGIVAPARPSPNYPFLRRRALLYGRALGGPNAPIEDKILYDAATRAERVGRFARFLDDGSGRMVAARPTRSGVAVVLCHPFARPEPFPFLVIFTLLAAGAMAAAASARLGGMARTAGLAISGSALAAPAYLWAGWAPAAALVLVAAAVAMADRRGAIAGAASVWRAHAAAYTYVLPTAASMAILVAVPFALGLLLGFYDHDRGEWHFVGLGNFAEILGGGGRSLGDPLNFWFTLGVTAAWTALNVVLHVFIGVSLALLLSRSRPRMRTLFWVLLVLPWAIPNYITALLWSGMFQSEYGAVNAILASLGLAKVSWFSSWSTAFAANVTTNTWLGFPFMMVVALGALTTVPEHLYEAAEVDGASPAQRFWHITLPHLRPAMLPAVALGSIWTFNMFNVIYLVSNGRPGGGTDILVTEAYRWAFERNERYGMAAAYATIIFAVLVLLIAAGRRLLRPEETA